MNTYNHYREWCDFDCGHEISCPTCNEKDQVLDDAADFAQAIVKLLYTKEQTMDIENFEFLFEELCWKLGVKIPKADIRVQAKEEKNISPILANWLRFNQEELKRIAQ